MLNNINKNSVYLDKLYTQYTTGKKIQNPSDNPIIAARALKFRTNVSMTEQYLRNTAQGTSWMQITEQGFTNVTSVLDKISELANQGASDTLALPDRQSIATNISMLLTQMGFEMNVQYAGRYVFSGLRTDTASVLESDESSTFNIQQNLDISDIEQVSVYSKADATAEPDVNTVYKLKLPYSGGSLSNVQITIGNNTYTATKTGGLPTMGNPVLTDNGEIYLAPEDVDILKQNYQSPIQVSYTVDGLKKGELNPRVYFTCTDVTAQNIVYNAASIQTDGTDYWVEVPPPNGQNLANVGAVSTDSAVADGVISVTAGTGTTPGRVYLDPAFVSDVTGAGGTFTLSYVSPKSYNMDNQALEFEFGVNTNIQINNLSKDVYTASMYADLKSFCDIINNIKISDDGLLTSKFRTENPDATDAEIAQMVADQKQNETTKYNALMHDMFNNLLAIVDKHRAEVSTEDTKLGSRMTRLDMINDRLSADRVSYTGLMSENEDVDYVELLMNLNSAEQVFTASLKAGAGIMQMSLIDFIR